MKNRKDNGNHQRKRMNRVTLNNTINGFLFLTPNLLGFLVFTLIPVIAVFVISFTDWNAFGSPKLIGFQNYLGLIKDANFKTAFFNNLKYTLMFVPGTILVALLFALALNRKIVCKGAFRVIYFLPHITSMVAVSIIWRMLYNGTYGPINSLLKSIGVMNPPNWLAEPKLALYAIIVMAIWKTYGYYMVIFMGNLANIPKDMYEVADLSGANAWQKFWYVTLPQLSPTMFFVTITCVISSFKVFDAINVMTQGGPGRSTYVLVYDIYTEAFTNYRFGYSSAISVVLFLMILAITLIQWRGQKNWVSYN